MLEIISDSEGWWVNLQIPKLRTYITDADDMRGDALQQTIWEDMIIHVFCTQRHETPDLIYYPLALHLFLLF